MMVKRSTKKTLKLNNNDKDSLLPIIIGVTGHRDLRSEDIPQLEFKVREIFEELRKNYPHTPLQLLSPLAEGADRLVARVGLEFNVKLIVPLPVPQEEYERDFHTPESKHEFKTLFQQADTYFELSLAEGNTLDSIRRDPDSRNRQYAQNGKYIASHSQILIALWDGMVTELIGGTSNVVRFKMGAPDLHTLQEPLDLIDCGPVYHIVTPRKSNLYPKGEVYSIHKRFPVDDPDADTVYTRILERVDQFNEDALSFLENRKAAIKKSRDKLLPHDQETNIPPICRSILNHYAIADALAIFNHRKRKRTMTGLFGLGVLAVGFLTTSHALEASWILLFYLGSFLLAYCWHQLAKGNNYQNKHLDYRILAEGLRVQFFWKMAGIEEDVVKHFLNKQRNELEWIRNAIRSCNIPVTNELDIHQGIEQKTIAYKLVREYWVYSQQKFFEKNADRDLKKIARQNSQMKLLLTIGFGLAAVVIFYDLFCTISCTDKNKIYEDIWSKIMMVLIHVMPMVAAAIVGYAEKMAVSEQAKQYFRMNNLLKRAVQYLDEYLQEKDFIKAEKLLLDLGDEILAENGDWLLLHRERPMEVPMG